MPDNVGNNTIFLSIPDDQLLALLGKGEAGGQGAEGIAAVINVATNRVYNYASHPEWVAQDILDATGNVWEAVILAYRQFSCFNWDTSGSEKATLEVYAQNFSYYAGIDSDLNMAWQIAQLALAGTLEDNTNGATSYFNPSIVQPSWAAQQTYLETIGAHVFYTVLPSLLRSRDIVTSAISSAYGAVENVASDIGSAVSSVESMITGTSPPPTSPDNTGAVVQTPIGGGMDPTTMFVLAALGILILIPALTGRETA